MQYIYCDESTIDKGTPFHAYGMLSVPQAIPDSIVLPALQALRDDPDIHDPQTARLDRATLQRGYFHASEDSKNAHSPLCRAIHRARLGSFGCHLLRGDAATRPNAAYDLPATLSGLTVFYSSEPVTFVVERRDGWNETTVAHWYARLEQQALRTIYYLPLLRCYFPSRSIEVGTKIVAGLQVVDFILWAFGRAMRGPDDWLSRLGPTFTTKASASTDEWQWGSLDWDHHASSGDLSYAVEPLSENEISNETISAALGECQRVLGYYRNNALPHHVTHLAPDIKAAVSPRTSDRVQAMASAYLKLFDTVPLISNHSSAGDVRTLLLYRWILALALREDLTHGVRTCQFMSRQLRTT